MPQRLSESASAPKTWGPFTGRQLTTVLCVLIVTVLFPVTSWAVTGSSVYLVDPHTGHHASVDSAGAVLTKVNGTAAVAGGVAAPAAFVESHEVTLTTSYAPILTPPAGKELIVTTIDEDWAGNNPATPSYADVTVANATTCASPNVNIENYFDFGTTSGNHEAELTPGYIVPSGKSLCALKYGASDPELFLSAFGYTVPAGSVAIPAATPAALVARR